ncbi:response regulator transcription factor [Uliginosibacterium sp. H1]|uniref:response regulator transcription factor n=1 Tax=Uliginosibacterium sp. H1 TaxID=3114757 RepID=UPI002E182D12|nr:response regulator transcription factor [Uliginosibacterium sp. H1]
MAVTALCLLSRDETLFARLRAAAGSRPAHRLSNPAALDSLAAGTLVVVDSALPGLPALGDARWRHWCGHLSLILASSTPSDAEGLAALECGAAGYCHAYAAVETLQQVIEVVASGELWVGRSLLGRLIGGLGRGLESRPAPPVDWAAALTEREREVARMAAMGDANARIAIHLGITERTVKAHLSAIFDKLQVDDRLQLALKVHGIR